MKMQRTDVEEHDSGLGCSSHGPWTGGRQSEVDGNPGLGWGPGRRDGGGVGGLGEGESTSRCWDEEC